MTTNPNLKRLIHFICNPDTSDDIIDMDCDMCCERLTCLAEQVAAGAKLSLIHPALEEHLRCWPDSREEFYALVTVIRAEINGNLADR